MKTIFRKNSCFIFCLLAGLSFGAANSFADNLANLNKFCAAPGTAAKADYATCDIMDKLCKAGREMANDQKNLPPSLGLPGDPTQATVPVSYHYHYDYSVDNSMLKSRNATTLANAHSILQDDLVNNAIAKYVSAIQIVSVACDQTIAMQAALTNNLSLIPPGDTQHAAFLANQSSLQSAVSSVGDMRSALLTNKNSITSLQSKGLSADQTAIQNYQMALENIWNLFNDPKWISLSKQNLSTEAQSFWKGNKSPFLLATSAIDTDVATMDQQIAKYNGAVQQAAGAGTDMSSYSIATQWNGTSPVSAAATDTSKYFTDNTTSTVSTAANASAEANAAAAASASAQSTGSTASENANLTQNLNPNSTINPNTATDPAASSANTFAAATSANTFATSTSANTFAGASKHGGADISAQSKTTTTTDTSSSDTSFFSKNADWLIPAAVGVTAVGATMIVENQVRQGNKSKLANASGTSTTANTTTASGGDTFAVSGLPTTIVHNTALPTITVQAKDSSGNNLASSGETISISCSGCSLYGTTQVMMNNGAGTFTGLVFTNADGQVNLVFSAAGIQTYTGAINVQ